MVGLGLLILRLTLAVTLVAHGAHELFGAFSGPGIGSGGLSRTAAQLAAAGLSPGLPLALLSAVIKFLGGLLLGCGLLTRWAAAAVLGLIGIEVWKMQLQWGYFLNWSVDPTRGHGIEYSAVLAGVLVCLILTGPGEWSWDGWRDRSAAARAAGRARLRQRT